MIQVEIRNESGADHLAVAVDGLPVMVEIVGFSEESETHALYRLACGLEYFLGADGLDLEIESPDKEPRYATTARVIDSWLEPDAPEGSTRT